MIKNEKLFKRYEVYLFYTSVIFNKIQFEREVNILDFKFNIKILLYKITNCNIIFIQCLPTLYRFKFKQLSFHHSLQS